MNAVVLDNEAVSVLQDVTHPKHRLVTSQMEALLLQRKRGVQVAAYVPNAVCVEAGWDRRTRVRQRSTGSA